MKPGLICLFLATPVVAVCALSARAEAATQLELKDMAARVIVTPEDRADIDLKVRNNPNLPKITVRMSGDKMIVSGQLAHKIKGCGRDVKITGIGTVRYDDLPVIHVRTPRDVKLSAASPTFGDIGQSRSLKLAMSGCGSWQAAPVAGKLNLANSGSGDITVASAAEADIAGSGSGKITVGAVRGRTHAVNAGSGDLDLGDIGGDLSVKTSGSGSSTINRVSGDVDIAGAGSGRFILRDGHAPRVNISLAGSGDVQFGGTAGEVEASIAGSGDVRLGRVTGSVNKRVIGSGSVRVGP
ncbi:GIN domain-containing protein [Asticcacaulis machinosus]|uniref:DUF2807 domain-containing protein n=1 Tax=Asticcacaulis machinosus TaxID=2984211 RepID=A0ABT5HM34_9CAUL|nr:DUF2807 domain-containing protein [Asticcacaulis machinosus]MDC7677315.1 DUF2807 domain-containing protein [Asticcacaulis machinosus]